MVLQSDDLLHGDFHLCMVGVDGQTVVGLAEHASFGQGRLLLLDVLRQGVEVAHHLAHGIGTIGGGTQVGHQPRSLLGACAVERRLAFLLHVEPLGLARLLRAELHAVVVIERGRATHFLRFFCHVTQGLIF